MTEQEKEFKEEFKALLSKYDVTIYSMNPLGADQSKNGFQISVSGVDIDVDSNKINSDSII